MRKASAAGKVFVSLSNDVSLESGNGVIASPVSFRASVRLASDTSEVEGSGGNAPGIKSEADNDGIFSRDIPSAVSQPLGTPSAVTEARGRAGVAPHLSCGCHSARGDHHQHEGIEGNAPQRTLDALAAHPQKSRAHTPLSPPIVTDQRPLPRSTCFCAAPLQPLCDSTFYWVQETETHLQNSSKI